MSASFEKAPQKTLSMAESHSGPDAESGVSRGGDPAIMYMLLSAPTPPATAMRDHCSSRHL